MIVKYLDWIFEVDKTLTEKTYKNIPQSGADICICNDCKNYVAYRDKVFPDEIMQLLKELGLDFRKEVEVTSYETLPNGLHHIGGWFHFKGELLAGQDCSTPLPSGGYNLNLTNIDGDFSIGFFRSSSLTFFEKTEGLIQVEFETSIPWVIDKSLEFV